MSDIDKVRQLLARKSLWYWQERLKLGVSEWWLGHWPWARIRQLETEKNHYKRWLSNVEAGRVYWDGGDDAH